jgi:hypothetical protein
MTKYRFNSCLVNWRREQSRRLFCEEIIMIVGTCGNCGGPVVMNITWLQVEPRPTCRDCGAMAKNKYGNTIEMEQKENGQDTRGRQTGADQHPSVRTGSETLGRGNPGEPGQPAGAANKGKHGEKR